MTYYRKSGGKDERHAKRLLDKQRIPKPPSKRAGPAAVSKPAQTLEEYMATADAKAGKAKK